MLALSSLSGGGADGQAVLYLIGQSYQFNHDFC